MSLHDLSRSPSGRLASQTVTLARPELESLVRAAVHQRLNAGGHGLAVDVDIRSDGSAVVTTTPR